MYLEVDLEGFGKILVSKWNFGKFGLNMRSYDVMNEERAREASVEYIEDAEVVIENTELLIYLKVTDSDIRSVRISPDVDTVGALKAKVFSKEISENFKIRLIFNGRIMIDSQPLSIYSKTILRILKPGLHTCCYHC